MNGAIQLQSIFRLDDVVLSYSKSSESSVLDSEKESFLVSMSVKFELSL